jgi:hypothetical protein
MVAKNKLQVINIFFTLESAKIKKNRQLSCIIIFLNIIIIIPLSLEKLVKK